ncbi:MAG: DUF177 domain-containing protein [Lachnospiraceae bacterium]|nr:DUF177 domain-containing protein [Lachnospiraceae bacterium]
MLINLSELFSCQGKVKTYTQNLEMEQFHGPVGDYEIVKKEPVVLRITHSGEKKMTVEGEAGLTLQMPCDRCLEPVEVPFRLSIEEELDMNQSDEERVEALDEQPYISGYYLDVDQLVGNELMLNLPMKVLCREACKGICNQCGTNLNYGTCDCDHSVPDPRMAAIQDIFKQFKEV